jgi:hypothetical protein
VVFAASFAHLEYYHIKDPALQISNGKGAVTDPNFDRSRETEPIIGNMYQYHLFPMLFIFALISFAALWDDMSFKLLGRYKRIKAAFIGVANLITAIVVEDFAWFANRWAVPLESEPKGWLLVQFSDWTSMHMDAIDVGSFVIPVWYLIGARVLWRLPQARADGLALAHGNREIAGVECSTAYWAAAVSRAQRVLYRF